MTITQTTPERYSRVTSNTHAHNATPQKTHWSDREFAQFTHDRVEERRRTLGETPMAERLAALRKLLPKNANEARTAQPSKTKEVFDKLMSESPE
jgi:hypothetical protein